MTAYVNRLWAPSGNRDADHFQATCLACGWTGAAHSNRTVEGRGLAERDTAQHNDARHTVPLRTIRVGGTFAIDGARGRPVWERSPEPEPWGQVRVVRRDDAGHVAATMGVHEETLVVPTDAAQVLA